MSYSRAILLCSLEVVMNNLTRSGKNQVSVCVVNGDVRPDLFEVADYDSDGGHDHIGSCKLAE